MWDKAALYSLAQWQKPCLVLWQPVKVVLSQEGTQKASEWFISTVAESGWLPGQQRNKSCSRTCQNSHKYQVNGVHMPLLAY